MAKKQKKAKVPAKKAKKTAPKRATKAAKREAIEPLADRIVVRPLTEAESGTRSPSGILIPDTVSKEKPEQGIVVATGPGKLEDGRRMPVSVSVGDRILFSKYGYDEVKIGGQEYFIVSEASVLAVIND